MSEHFDDLTRTVAERTTRRSAVAGLGTLALGALTLAGLGQSAEAKQDNACKQCKRKSATISGVPRGDAAFDMEARAASLDGGGTRTHI